LIHTLLKGKKFSKNDYIYRLLQTYILDELFPFTTVNKLWYKVSFKPPVTIHISSSLHLHRIGLTKTKEWTRMQILKS